MAAEGPGKELLSARLQVSVCVCGVCARACVVAGGCCAGGQIRPRTEPASGATGDPRPMPRADGNWGTLGPFMAQVCSRTPSSNLSASGHNDVSPIPGPGGHWDAAVPVPTKCHQVTRGLFLAQTSLGHPSALPAPGAPRTPEMCTWPSWGGNAYVPDGHQDTCPSPALLPVCQVTSASPTKRHACLEQHGGWRMGAGEES